MEHVRQLILKQGVHSVKVANTEAGCTWQPLKQEVHSDTVANTDARYTAETTSAMPTEAHVTRTQKQGLYSVTAANSEAGCTRASEACTAVFEIQPL